MLRARYSAEEWQAWESANEAVRERQQAYDDAMIAGTVDPVYKFDHGVLQDSDVEVGLSSFRSAVNRCAWIWNPPTTICRST